MVVESPTVSENPSIVSGAATPFDLIYPDDLALEKVSCSVHSSESEICTAVMSEVACLSINTVLHIPSSIYPMLAHVLSFEFRSVYSFGMWGFAHLHLFAKAVLRSMPCRGKRKSMLPKPYCLLVYNVGSQAISFLFGVRQAQRQHKSV